MKKYLSYYENIDLKDYITDLEFQLSKKRQEIIEHIKNRVFFNNQDKLYVIYIMNIFVLEHIYKTLFEQVINVGDSKAIWTNHGDIIKNYLEALSALIKYNDISWQIKVLDYLNILVKKQYSDTRRSSLYKLLYSSAPYIKKENYHIILPAILDAASCKKSYEESSKEALKVLTGLFADLDMQSQKLVFTALGERLQKNKKYRVNEVFQFLAEVSSVADKELHQQILDLLNIEAKNKKHLICLAIVNLSPIKDQQIQEKVLSLLENKHKEFEATDVYKSIESLIEYLRPEQQIKAVRFLIRIVNKMKLNVENDLLGYQLINKLLTKIDINSQQIGEDFYKQLLKGSGIEFYAKFEKVRLGGIGLLSPHNNALKRANMLYNHVHLKLPQKVLISKFLDKIFNYLFKSKLNNILIIKHGMDRELLFSVSNLFELKDHFTESQKKQFSKLLNIIGHEIANKKHNIYTRIKACVSLANLSDHYIVKIKPLIVELFDSINSRMQIKSWHESFRLSWEEWQDILKLTEYLNAQNQELVLDLFYKDFSNNDLYTFNKRQNLLYNFFAMLDKKLHKKTLENLCNIINKYSINKHSRERRLFVFQLFKNLALNLDASNHLFALDIISKLIDYYDLRVEATKLFIQVCNNLNKQYNDQVWSIVEDILVNKKSNQLFYQSFAELNTALGKAYQKRLFVHLPKIVCVFEKDFIIRFVNPIISLSNSLEPKDKVLLLPLFDRYLKQPNVKHGEIFCKTITEISPSLDQDLAWHFLTRYFESLSFRNPRFFVINAKWLSRSIDNKQVFQIFDDNKSFFAMVKMFFKKENELVKHNLIGLVLKLKTLYKNKAGIIIQHHSRQKDTKLVNQLSKRFFVSKQFANKFMINWQEISKLKKLKTGNFAKIYKAVWRNADIVVKKLKAQDLTDNELAKLKQELSINSVLWHPNIVRFWGYCKKPISLVLEYCNLGTLFDNLYRYKGDQAINPKLSGDDNWQLRVKLIKDIIAGLYFLHSKKPNKIIHQDLKSSNILLLENQNQWTAKITDFGLAQTKNCNSVVSALTANKDSGFSGTIRWAAPELAIDDQGSVSANEKTDVYSCGLVMYELVAKRLPYANKNQTQLFAAKVKEFLGKNMLSLPKRTPKDLAVIIKQAYSGNPENRQSTEKLYGQINKVKNLF